jgi:hypothetical protein
LQGEVKVEKMEKERSAPSVRGKEKKKEEENEEGWPSSLLLKKKLSEF